MSHSAPSQAENPRYRYFLALAALGVVYGDIGTSPLYAVREAFHGPYAMPLTPANVLGVLSLIFWSLVLVVTLKYLVFVVRADNHGEGGILALLSLAVPQRRRRATGRRWGLTILGLFGASLLYGDGVITPAISVLSAVEGLSLATPSFAPFVIPITIGILVLLFLFQYRGTAGVGAVFGPVMLLWFLTLAVLGTASLVQTPEVLQAISPYYAASFFAQNGLQGFFILAIVVLVITGGEALYADMGHFGRWPIRFAWFSIVLPSLLLNYFGQGALLLRNPSAAHHPFYNLAPGWMTYPLVALSVAAAIIASQALISGAFSLTRQAIQLGFSPRMEIVHTSEEEIGQVYMPAINWAMLAACIALVLGFRSSSALATAYGIGVTLTMTITTLLAYIVARRVWKWRRLPALLFLGFFLLIDLAFLFANLPKIPQGAWFPLLMAAAVFTLLSTWKRGREILEKRLQGKAFPADLFVQDVRENSPHRVPGTAVFMTRDPVGIPVPLLHNIRHNHVLHQRVILLSIITEEVPQVVGEDRLKMEDLGEGIVRISAHYGFKETPSVLAILHRARLAGLDISPSEVTFFLGRETLLATREPGMALWREKLFSLMSKNSRSATSFYKLPANQVVELGMHVEL